MRHNLEEKYLILEWIDHVDSKREWCYWLWEIQRMDLPYCYCDWWVIYLNCYIIWVFLLVEERFRWEIERERKKVIGLPLKYSPSSTRDNASISERLSVISRIRSSSRKAFSSMVADKQSKTIYRQESVLISSIYPLVNDVGIPNLLND